MLPPSKRERLICLRYGHIKAWDERNFATLLPEIIYSLITLEVWHEAQAKKLNCQNACKSRPLQNDVFSDTKNSQWLWNMLKQKASQIVLVL